jgi:epoxyqueuosine reductase
MKSHQLAYRSKQVKHLAEQFGFQFCGIAKADRLSEEEPLLEEWLKRENHGTMAYMENHFEKRLDPRILVPGTQSVVTLMYNYYPETEMATDYKIARYAYGRDYHKVIKKKLKNLMSGIRESLGQVEGRFFVDSAPVMERVWAEKSGLGWRAKNTLLINKQAGSYYFLAVMLLDIELEPDAPVQTDHCGTCTRCIDACPTDAILPDRTLNAQKCISYLTIELKSEIEPAFRTQMEDWIFGCDICQEVCPWNRFSQPHKEPQFNPKPELRSMNSEKWEALQAEEFDVLFQGSAVKRTGYDGLKRNITFVKHGKDQ